MVGWMVGSMDGWMDGWLVSWLVGCSLARSLVKRREPYVPLNVHDAFMNATMPNDICPRSLRTGLLAQRNAGLAVCVSGT